MYNINLICSILIKFYKSRKLVMDHFDQSKKKFKIYVMSFLEINLAPILKEIHKFLISSIEYFTVYTLRDTILGIPRLVKYNIIFHEETNVITFFLFDIFDFCFLNS